MLIKGKYNTAKVFSKNIDKETKLQIERLLDQDFIKDKSIRIMPDCHAGAGCVIGFTANLGDKIIPNIVGVDIGCGMLVVELGKIEIDLKKFDSIVKKYIPAGKEMHNLPKERHPDIEKLYCYRELKNSKRFERSIGTLGGGNHFIELDKDDSENVYLVIHSGSRNLGYQIAQHYQKLAINLRKGMDKFYKEKEKLIKEYKAKGKKKEIQKQLKKMKREYKKIEPDYPKDLCFLEGEYRYKYLHDMKIAQNYASKNRKTMAKIILNRMWNKDLDDYIYWETIHNYIDHDTNMIRKGAISAHLGEKVLIPLNMRDGALICIGKGNEDWNNSAPHGAGRIMSRRQAHENLNMEEFKKQMKDIYSTSVSIDTLDEAPMAYKPMEEIIAAIKDTVEIEKHIKPIYNFKAKE
ncbi:MAG: RtcB family protein [Tissierellia bacterium]|nr:RtcB family protein [Tissierellia bacterium]